MSPTLAFKKKQKQTNKQTNKNIPCYHLIQPEPQQLFQREETLAVNQWF